MKCVAGRPLSTVSSRQPVVGPTQGQIMGGSPLGRPLTASLTRGRLPPATALLGKRLVIGVPEPSVSPVTMVLALAIRSPVLKALGPRCLVSRRTSCRELLVHS